MGTVTTKHNKAFVNEFKQTCKDLNIKQSDAIRKAMNETIEQASKIKK